MNEEKEGRKMNRKLLPITATLIMLSALALAAPASAKEFQPAESHFFLPMEGCLSVESQSSLEIPSITPESPATVEVENTHILELTINVNEEVSDVGLTVQQLVENFPTKFAGQREFQITLLPEVYRYFKFISEGITDAQIENVIIEFEVERSWISEHSIDEESIALGRFENKSAELEPLPTTRLGEDAAHIYFTSTSPSLSYFAITGVGGGEGPPENQEPFEIEEPPENVQFSNLRISPDNVGAGEQVTISVDVTNLSENVQVTVPVKLKINGVLKETEPVDLDPGEIETVEFTVTEEIPGTYDVEVGGQTDSFEVVGEGEPPREGGAGGGLLLGIVMIAIVVVFAMVLLYARRKWV